MTVREIAGRLELFVDDWLIDRLSGGAAQRLHEPVPREAALVTDRPWEGNACGFISVFRDGDLCRMYYKAWYIDLDSGDEKSWCDRLRIAYAESRDGIHWERPDLGLIPHEGSLANNLMWAGHGPEMKGSHGFAPFKDENPACMPEARYKAVGAQARCGQLYGAQSPDGIHWSIVREEPLITTGAFDSQNLAFWDGVRGEYRAYIRDFRSASRGIRTATSKDFLTWTEPEWLDYPGSDEEQLYTNQVMPYARAPHIFVGFPTRYVERPWSRAVEAWPELEHRRRRSDFSMRFGTALSDGLFMSSRDGRTFKRWAEAFLRPGPQLDGNWTYGDNYQAWGLLDTDSALSGAPRELSLYATEGYWRGTSTVFRRYSLRMDGFVSIHSPMSGGELLTPPLTFEGRHLELNVSTSAAGNVYVELADADGRPLDGFRLSDCTEICGDELARRVSWGDREDVAELAGRPVRLRFVMKDADLYALRFVGQA